MRWMVVVACLIGCGGSTSSSTSTLSNTPPPPPAVSDGDALVDHLRAERDDVCACAGHYCVREVERDMKRWRDRHKEELAKHPPATAEQQRLEAEIIRCEPIAEAKTDTNSVMAVFVRFKNEMCVCADHGDASCAKKVTDEISKWATDNADNLGSFDKPTEEETKVGTQLAECTTKAMMAGMPQQPQATP